MASETVVELIEHFKLNLQVSFCHFLRDFFKKISSDLLQSMWVTATIIILIKFKK